MGKEHIKNARPSTRGKHQKGKRRQATDAGGEKGDARRKPQDRKRKRSEDKEQEAQAQGSGQEEG